jgi:hypothetical protein
MESGGALGRKSASDTLGKATLLEPGASHLKYARVQVAENARDRGRAGEADRGRGAFEADDARAGDPEEDRGYPRAAYAGGDGDDAEGGVDAEWAAQGV